jgi:Kef-type K+ transport system membrane component KefB
MTMHTSSIFLIAMMLILVVPYAIWRLARTDYYAPLVVVQILTGILLGPAVLGAAYPHYYQQVFSPTILQTLNGIAWWGVMLFVWIAGIELDLRETWKHRVESSLATGLALFIPLLLGGLVAVGLQGKPGWVGAAAQPWQFVAGIGMACAVTALPILILFLEKLTILRSPLGQRILRYASLDDVVIWAVLALILLDWQRVGLQVLYLAGFALMAWLVRRLLVSLAESDRWYIGFIWLVLSALAADVAGLHFMVGAFLAGAVLDRDWFNQTHMDLLRHHVLLTLMPVFFLSTGLRTTWEVGGLLVVGVAALLLIAAVGGKLLGVHIAGRLLKWAPGEAALIGWLLQTKALIMIIFVNVLLDHGLITSASFTALLLMAIASTMLTIPVVTPLLRKLGITQAA